jgi:hypothetical protein
MARQLNLPGLSDSAVDSIGAAIDEELLAPEMGSSNTVARSLSGDSARSARLSPRQCPG